MAQTQVGQPGRQNYFDTPRWTKSGLFGVQMTEPPSQPQAKEGGGGGGSEQGSGTSGLTDANAGPRTQSHTSCLLVSLASFSGKLPQMEENGCQHLVRLTLSASQGTEFLSSCQL